MIEILKHEDLVDKFGGRFKLSSVIQKRWRELLMGARPMVEPGKLTPMEIIVRELREGKLGLNAAPAPAADQTE